jgi:hypothetical protein
MRRHRARALSVAFALFAVLLAAAPFVSAANVTADAGNVTRVNIIITGNQTRHWQGFAGRVFFGTNASAPSILNATGGFVNGSDLFFQIDCDNPTSATGFVFLSNGTNTPSGLTAGNLTQLDAFVGAVSDSGSRTFTNTSTFALTQGTVTSVPTVFSYVNESAQSVSFREGYFNQGNDLVFASVVEASALGYNRSFFGYQALVPAPNQSTRQYSIFGDITFTCPGVTPPPAGGGGGGGGRGRPQIITRPPARPLPPDVQLPPRIERPEEILRELMLFIEPNGSQAFEQRIMRGRIVNKNALDIGQVRVNVTAPELLQTFSPAHPYPSLFWTTWLGGWSNRGPAEQETEPWGITDLPFWDWVPALSETPFTFLATPPLLLPREVILGGTAYSGEMSIATNITIFAVETPSFAVYAREKNPGVWAIYSVVDNRGGKEKDINIELMLNKGRSTLVAEMLGTLHVPADTAAIFAHEYRFSSAAQAADTIAARLYGPDGTQIASFPVN